MLFAAISKARKRSVSYFSGETLGMLLIGVIRPMLNDSRGPQPLETPPIEYIPR